MSWKAQLWAAVSSSLVRFVLLPGQRHDLVGVPPLIEGIAFDALIGDKGFNSDALRADHDGRGALAVIPPKANRKAPIPAISQHIVGVT